MELDPAIGNAVEIRTAGSALVLTLNRPEKRNAINARSCSVSRLRWS